MSTSSTFTDIAKATFGFGKRFLKKVGGAPVVSKAASKAAEPLAPSPALERDQPQPQQQQEPSCINMDEITKALLMLEPSVDHPDAEAQLLQVAIIRRQVMPLLCCANNTKPNIVVTNK